MDGHPPPLRYDRMTVGCSAASRRFVRSGVSIPHQFARLTYAASLGVLGHVRDMEGLPCSREVRTASRRQEGRRQQPGCRSPVKRRHEETRSGKLGAEE
jgi:hypothetical protein